MSTRLTFIQIMIAVKVNSLPVYFKTFDDCFIYKLENEVLYCKSLEIINDKFEVTDEILPNTNDFVICEPPKEYTFYRHFYLNEGGQSGCTNWISGPWTPSTPGTLIKTDTRVIKMDSSNE